MRRRRPYKWGKAKAIRPRISDDEQKKLSVKKALWESETKFRDLSEKSLVGIYLIQHGLFRYVNPRFAEIFGYRVEEIIDKKAPRDLIFPEDVEMVEENIRKRVSGETKSLAYEFRGITKNGQTINVDCYSSRTEFRGESALIGTLQDITERKIAEELLRQAEEKYRGIFENAVEGIFQSTPEGRFIAANPALAKMLGYASPEEMVTSLSDISSQVYVDPAKRTEFMRVLERDGIIRGFECEHYRRDGSRMWVSMDARAVRARDGSVIYYEGTVADITEKKKAEDQVRALNELNRTIVDNAPVAIFILDKDGTIRNVNPALASITGLGTKAAEKLIGFNWLKNPFTIKSGLARHIRRGLKGESFQLWDFPFIDFKGDNNLYIDIKGVPLRGKDGAAEGLLCIIEDTTERVKTRAKLMQEAKMSFIGKLAAGVAHQLNNPLAMVVAYSELAAKYFGTCRGAGKESLESKELSDYLSIIEEEAFRCKIVVDDLLSLPQKDGSEITRIEVNQLLHGLLDLMNFGKSNTTLVKEFSDSLPSVHADITALRQVFVNLISNALDAVEGRSDAAITVRTRSKRGRVFVEVEDNGVGIPDSIIDKVFEPFFTTKESKRGVGLGLFLCHDLLRNMGGSVRVESNPGKGTTFFVSLPADRK
ncbi:MAG: Sporulation kinase E [Syntrophorhabdaceae bacterium PtaU1.Bin034]|nr:MAG: Sporulation kinase E [Syntrophorhabdaceae bacterium PtaU1.Bin034]